jgi:hypothetical protein
LLKGFLCVAPTRPVDNVLALTEPRQVKDAKARRNTVECLQHRVSTLAAGIIVVWKHDDVCTAKVLGIVSRPLRDIGRDVAPFPQQVSFELALDHEHLNSPISVDTPDQFRKAVWHFNETIETVFHGPRQPRHELLVGLSLVAQQRLAVSVQQRQPVAVVDEPTFGIVIIKGHPVLEIQATFAIFLTSFVALVEFCTGERCDRGIEVDAVKPLHECDRVTTLATTLPAVEDAFGGVDAEPVLATTNRARPFTLGALALKFDAAAVDLIENRYRTGLVDPLSPILVRPRPAVCLLGS